ncbi:MAG TPA: mechanosensitive ion channel family protein [Terriglobales bacterium]|nr:mechanosensitive ion channel family protein [Terriglobales bacterium]
MQLPLQVFNPVHQWHSFREVVEQWRSDSLEFLRQDAPRLVLILIVYGVLVWSLRIVTRRIRRFSKRQGLPSGVRAQQLATLASVINGSGTFVLIFLALIQILGVLQINVGPLLASAGIAGLAIGFGAQTMVKDVINGFFILLENQYDVGDSIRIAGVQGTVEYMSLRRTVLRDSDGTVHTIPNSEIHIVSNTTRDWTQVSLHVSAAYTEPSDKVIGLLKDVAQDVWNDAALHDALVSIPEVPGIDRVSGQDVDYLVLAKTRPGKQLQITRELRRRIKACFEENHVQPGGPGRMYVVSVGGVPGTSS